MLAHRAGSGNADSTNSVRDAPERTAIPCKVTMANGEVKDLCLLHFSSAPPCQYHFRNILLLDDVVDIEASELSLSHDLRLESMLAGEIRMAFYPIY